MNVAQKRLSLGTRWLGTFATILLLVSVSQAQSSQILSAHGSSPQSATTVLSSLPEADTIIYASPQRILNDAAPKVMVHDADLEDDKFHRYECIGINCVLTGWAGTSLTDDELMAKGMDCFEGLYRQLRK